MLENNFPGLAYALACNASRILVSWTSLGRWEELWAAGICQCLGLHFSLNTVTNNICSVWWVLRRPVNIRLQSVALEALS